MSKTPSLAPETIRECAEGIFLALRHSGTPDNKKYDPPYVKAAFQLLKFEGVIRGSDTSGHFLSRLGYERFAKHGCAFPKI